MLDPVTASALLIGLGAVADKLIDKLVLDPLLKPAAEKAEQWLRKPITDAEKKNAFAKAIENALEDAARGDAISRAQTLQLESALTRLDENARAELMARVLLAASPDDIWLVDSALLDALALTEKQRAPLARFLVFFRQRLALIPELKPLLDVQHQQTLENALRAMYPHLAVLAETVATVNGKRVIQTTNIEPAWQPRAYLDALAQEFRRLRLGILETSAFKAGAEPIYLDEIYTALDVMDLVRVASEEKKEREQFLGREDQETLRMTALEAVSQPRETRVVLLGAPGSGKSAFVNFLAYALTRERIARGAADGIAQLQGWELGALFPARVVLRELIEWADKQAIVEGDAETLWDYIAQETMLGYKQEFPALKKHLQGNGGILLLDGLDEVRNEDERRAFIKEAIEAFARANGGIRIVVTCRPYAYDKDDWKLTGFAARTLAPFDDSQIENFTNVWYRVIGAREGWNEKLIDEKASDLIAAAQLEHLRKLAEQPLLLTLMATLNAKGKLPDDRADLYDQTVELLLDEWQKHKGGGLHLQTFGLTAKKLHRVMARVALDAHTRQARAPNRKTDAVADIGREELRDALAPELNDSVDAADKVIAYMQTRAGLLLPQAGKTYTFPHRSFQEFMAASDALQSPDFPLDLVGRVREDSAWWREVYLLAAGRIHADKFPSAVGLIENLCDTDCPSPPAPLPLGEGSHALLAAQAAVDIALVKEAHKYPKYARLLKRLQDWLIAILESENFVARERAQAGVLLAKLGDTRPGVQANDFLFCEIPAGDFLMGSDSDDADAVSDGRPQITYTIKNNFYISRYPITNAQFELFERAAQGYTKDEWWTDAGLKWRKGRTGHDKAGGVFDLPNHPVVNITFYEAVAFCRWLNERLQSTDYRLHADRQRSWVHF